MKSPNHIAIIMDGNGRWGLKNHKSRLVGHKFGIKNIKNIVNYCIKHEIDNITLFALSSDNLKKRSKKEIENLFDLLENYLKKNINFFKEKKIKLNFIGEDKSLPKKIMKILKKFSNETKLYKSKLFMNIAFNYSAKEEIINSCKQVVRNQKQINQKNIAEHLYTSTIPDPEILVRTGGYSRLSDFLLWQCSYTEIFFVKKLWPDFKSNDLDLIIKKFIKLKRNFGA
jgi:undecaprenyl diphosphate synthase